VLHGKNSLLTKESESQPLKLESKHQNNHSWKIVSAAVLIDAHDGIGLDDDDEFVTGILSILSCVLINFISLHSVIFNW